MNNKQFVILILVLIASVAITICAGIFTNGFESVSSLYVVCNDKAYAKGDRTAEFTEYESGDLYTLTVKSSGFDKSKTIDYTVTAQINADYSVTADGTALTLAAGTDVTDKVVQSVDGNEVTIKLYVLRDFLKDVYGYSEVETDTSAVPYTVIVSNGKKSVNLTLEVNVVESQGITVTPTSIVF